MDFVCTPHTMRVLRHQNPRIVSRETIHSEGSGVERGEKKGEIKISQNPRIVSRETIHSEGSGVD
jgi:hypothetical protein